MYGLGCQPERVTEEAEFTPGLRIANATAEGAKEYIYIQASEALAVNAWVALTDNYHALEGSSAGADVRRGGRAAVVSEVAMPNGHWGWAQIDGQVRAEGVNGMTQNNVNTNGIRFTGTPGVVDDANAGPVIEGAQMVAAPVSGVGTFVLNNPHVSTV